MTDRLPSWRPGPTRDVVLGFLDDARSVPLADRVAYFDNDGTLWCERPTYVQYEFFVDALRRRVEHDPALGTRAEYAAVLAGDTAAIAELGLARIAYALAAVFERVTPAAFTSEVRSFMAQATHARGLPMRSITYQPMIELIAALRALDFTVGIVSGGGTEFVRAISDQIYGVAPELVVGTLVAYDLERDAAGRPVLHRTARILGDANEGGAKVTNIQTQLGRRPVLAAGNSAGDREMLEWAAAANGPSLALLVDHDDAEREYAYASEAATIADAEAITDVATRLGWTTVSMARDWERVFS